MDLRGRLLALVVAGLFAATLTWVALSLQRAAHRSEQELAELQLATATELPKRTPQENAALARAEAAYASRAELLRTQIERLSARLDRQSDLLQRKNADYEALKADFEKAAELLNQFRPRDSSQAAVTVATKPVETEANPPASAEEMLASLNAELRQARADLAEHEKNASLQELQMLEIEDRQQRLHAAATSALVRAGAAAAPALADLLSDRRPAIRRWAANVLAEIGPDAASAADALHDATSDPDEEVSIAARKALRRIEMP